ncbi:MAG: BTAD domain-containing putative transcriptional regulator [Caldilineaceae bacterium]
MLHINLLGSSEIYLDDQLLLRFRTRKAQALLIYLAVTERSWTRDALATLFWPETDDASARKNLRDILPPLRRQLAGYLLIDGEMIGLNMSGQSKCDVLNFRTVLEKQLQNIDTNTLAETLHLYGGAFLEGFATSRISADFEMWALRERERLHQLALMGFTTLCRRQQENGAYEAALVTNRQLLKFAPWDEASHRRQMLLLAQSGQQAAALAHFDACRHILAEELDAEPDAETVALYEQIKAGRALGEPAQPAASPSPTAPGPQPPPHNLPRQLTSLIGRAGDIDAVQQLLKEESTALLTLVGQGGVGKTRLALAVAQQWRTHAAPFFPDGIWFVPLAGIAAGEQATEQIVGAIAQAMGVTLGGAAPLSQQLIRALQGQQLLLVLDNFEHLVAEQAFLLEIVQTAQQVKILITSREQLHLHAERLYPVSGLLVPETAELSEQSHLAPLPGQDDNQQKRLPSPLDLKRYTSVQLFIARAQQRLPEFHLTTQNQHNIGRMCRLLGGVPLGIELAAQLYVEQGAAVLTQLIAEIELLDPLEPQPQTGPVGLDHLQTPAIDLPARQRSIYAVFLHSWRLLTPAEQMLLRHCAIFRGGFTREAILAVADGNSANLLALVMKSLVRRDSHDRYDLHELVRQYVIEQLQQEPTVVHAAAQKHAAYFAELMAGQEETLLQQLEFHQMLQTEIYNIRAMWHWLTERIAIDQTAIALLNRCVTCFFQFFTLTSQRQEALTLAQHAIESLRTSLLRMEHSEPKTHLLGYLLSNAAEAGVRTKERKRVKEWVDEAKAIGEAFDDAALLAQVYLTLAIIDASGPNQHVELLDSALIWAERSARPFLQAHVILAAIPVWVSSLQTRDKATSRCAELMRIINTHGYRYLLGDALFSQGMVHQSHEEYERAIQTIHQGLEACHSGQGSTLAVRMAHEALGKIYMQIRKLTEAQKWAHAAYQQSKIQGNQLSVLNNLYTMSFAQIHLKNWTTAQNYLQELVSSAEAIEATQFTVLGYMGLGMLHNHQQLYKEGILYYQKAAELATQANYPGNWAVSLSGIANAYLFQEQFDKAYETIEPLLVDDKLFSLNNRATINLAAITYRVLNERQDSRAEQILERVHTILQTELAKFTTPDLRAAFIENDVSVRNILNWWKAKHAA